MTTRFDRPSLKAASVAATICLVLNASILLGVMEGRPAYLRDYRLNDNPDAVHYVLLGHNSFIHHNFSRSAQAPFVPDMVRTPVYPLFAGALDLIGSAVAIYLAQITLAVGSCLLLYRIAGTLFGARTALFASAMMGADVMLAVCNFEAMSEPLFLFLTLSSALFILNALAALIDGRDEGRIPVGRLMMGGICLGLAILTRPAALYLPVIYAVWIAGAGVWRGRTLYAVRGAAVLTLATVPLVGLWVARNASVFALPKLTTIDNNNYVYFFGAGAYQVRYGVSLEKAQEMISAEFKVVPYTVAQNLQRTHRSAADVDAELRAATGSVLRKYPKDLAVSVALSLVKASLSHNVDKLAIVLGRTWTAPGTGPLVRGEAEAYRRIQRNGLVLTAAFAWEVVHSFVTLLFALLGVILALKERHLRPIGLLLVAVLAYFYLTVALFGFDAYSRCRVPVLPYLFLFAGLGMSRLWGTLTGSDKTPAAPKHRGRSGVSSEPLSEAR